MSRTTWIFAIIILIAVVIGAAYVVTQPASAPVQQTDTDTDSASSTGNALVGATGESSIITYSDIGFAPKSLTIALGTTITWSNQSSHTLWIEGSQGGDCSLPEEKRQLNECASIASGGTYSHTFTAPGIYTYANHDRASDTGSIVVSEDIPQ